MPTAETQVRKLHVWRHNSFFGHAAMTKQNMTNIISAPSTTREAKDIAGEIYDLSCQLERVLKTRIDPS